MYYSVFIKKLLFIFNEKGVMILLNQKNNDLNFLIEMINYQENFLHHYKIINYFSTLNKIIKEIEIDRIKYLIKSHTRMRLWKIENECIDFLNAKYYKFNKNLCEIQFMYSLKKLYSNFSRIFLHDFNSKKINDYLSELKNAGLKNIFFFFVFFKSLRKFIYLKHKIIFFGSFRLYKNLIDSKTLITI
ncbi:hypothetical protein (nucleomorph) [Guillardia theta]|uniref:Uncharacterized protein n=1 Tax=Guillardia theta TaxID=55529 RepID=Q98S97_GUITH|nr:hypothetical protein GTHECHR3042 [Guillardia theta]AAK39686.1 hypothetical protein [Guillardia theta]